MYDDLTQEAVLCALAGDWARAVDVNLELLKKHPGDVSTLNRTAKAFMEVGDLKKAREYSEKVLLIDSENRIAGNCLKRWRHLKSLDPAMTEKATVKEFFIEEAGRTKVVSLVKLGEGSIIAKLDNGREVALEVHQHKVCVCTKDGKYIGCLPDNITAKMFRTTQQNVDHTLRYKIFIRSVDEHDVKIFVRKID